MNTPENHLGGSEEVGAEVEEVGGPFVGGADAARRVLAEDVGLRGEEASTAHLQALRHGVSLERVVDVVHLWKTRKTSD